MPDEEPSDQHEADDADRPPQGSGTTGSGGGNAALAAPFVLIGAIIVGAGIGQLLDRFVLETERPWGTIIMATLFLAVGVYHVVRDVMR